MSSTPPLRIRTAGAGDAELLLAWRNDPTVRGWSRNPGTVSAAEHRRWLAGVLADPDRHLLVVETADGGEPVATLRYDLLGAEGGDRRSSWEVSINVAAEARGRGVGRVALAAGDAWLAGTEPEAAEVVAMVRTGNSGSERLFAGLGYRATTPPEPAMSRFVRVLTRP